MICHSDDARSAEEESVEIGYRSTVAAHMANLAYRKKQRVTFEEAKVMKQEF